jgi:hypothetical protein
MFERDVQYEAAYVGKFPTFEDDMGPAFAWAERRAHDFLCGLTVIAPTRSHFKDIGPLSVLPASVGQETPKTLGSFRRTQPVIISCWPTEKDLERLDKATGLRALAVIPWIEEEINTWRQARGAVDLLGVQPVPAVPTIADPVVEAAMRSVTRMVNLSTGLTHPSDRSAAIWALKVLKRNGHRLDPEELRVWAMANGWRADTSRQLGEYAAGVVVGKAYKAGRSPWKPQIIRIWRKDAAGGSSLPLP